MFFRHKMSKECRKRVLFMKAKVIGLIQICAGWIGLLIGAVIGSVLDLYFYGALGSITSYATFFGAVIGIGYTLISLQTVLKQHRVEENLS